MVTVTYLIYDELPFLCNDCAYFAYLEFSDKWEKPTDYLHM